tara:strand:+ start:2790 stop:3065 length:276 start_codon:yes stop_codon:yes gene_type:complete
LGVWPNLEAHLKFLASPARNEVLGPQEAMLEFQWTAHVELDSMSSLPLDAPILALKRLSVKEIVWKLRSGCNKAMHTQAVQGSHPLKVAHN